MADEKKPPADEKAKAPPAKDPGAAQGPMSEQDIRDAGLMIDVPYEAPDPTSKPMTYSADGDAEEWVMPEGFTMGGVAWDDLPPIDPRVLAAFGVAPSEEGSTDQDAAAGST